MWRATHNTHTDAHAHTHSAHRETHKGTRTHTATHGHAQPHTNTQTRRHTLDDIQKWLRDGGTGSSTSRLFANGYTHRGHLELNAHR